ncbi:MAG: hypothetical protein QG602_3449 [Verrucomicrobiota bacterium]|nr:hypothetical protein [Verrucomicrobiota bacterium]
MGAVLVIYIALAGTTVPWPHRVVHYPTLLKCQQAVTTELAQVRRQYVVAQYACLSLPVTPTRSR